MNEKALRILLEAVQNGTVDTKEAVEKIKGLPYEDIGFAKVDYHRHLRQGVPEVVYCEGKTPEQICEILKKLVQNTDSNILATRATAQIYAEVRQVLPQAEYRELGRIIVIRQGEQKNIGRLLVVSAGTSDIPVAEEAASTAEILGNNVERLFDVGVAGVHRLLYYKNMLHEARVIIVAAGMEGALPSVVGGLVDKPVIAVPTSVGYGASFNGLAALLGMLNSCASGVAVVNIDNGFGAGYIASQINHLGGEDC